MSHSCFPRIRGAALSYVLWLAACGGDGSHPSTQPADPSDKQEHQDEETSEDAGATSYPNWASAFLDAINQAGPTMRPTTQEELDRIEAARGPHGHDNRGNPLPFPEVCAAVVTTAREAPRPHFVTLESLCQELSKAGAPCPKDFVELLGRVGGRCSEGTYRASSARHCGLDSVREDLLGGWINWRFSATSGALVGVYLRPYEEFGCEGHSGDYIAGTTMEECAENDARVCSLCLSGHARDADCQAKVLEVLPSQACTSPKALSAGCGMCGSDSNPEVFPEEGAPCGSPDGCEECQGFNCSQTCTCFVDGISRWTTWCIDP